MSHYQYMGRRLAGREKAYLETPTADLKEKCIAIREYMRGIKKTLSFVDNRMDDQELDLRVV